MNSSLSSIQFNLLNFRKFRSTLIHLPKRILPNSKSKSSTPFHYSFTLFTIVEGILFISSWLVKVQNHLLPRAWIRNNHRHSNYLGLHFFSFFPSTQKKARGKNGERTREKRGKWWTNDVCEKPNGWVKKDGAKEKDPWGGGE